MKSSQTLLLDSPIMETASVERSLLNCLVFVGGERSGEIVVLGNEPLVIGRSNQCGLQLSDQTVSRNHAEIHLRGAIAEVRDLGSTNGTYVNNVRVENTGVIDAGALVQIGDQVMRFTMRSQAEVHATDAIAAELNRAARYVLAQLPPKIERGPVILDWDIVQCPKLSGDIFGFREVGRDGYAIFLIEVSGQGASAAMHSTKVQEILNQEMIPGVDLRNPAQVLTYLNRRFPMESHQGMCLNVWYGYYELASRRLTYSSGGHHASYLVAPDRSHVVPLLISDPMLGAFPAQRFQAAVVDVPRSWNLLMFSDGAFDIIDKSGKPWTVSDFEELISQKGFVEPGEPERLRKIVQEAASPGKMSDDSLIVTATFV